MTSHRCMNLDSLGSMIHAGLTVRRLYSTASTNVVWRLLSGVCPCVEVLGSIREFHPLRKESVVIRFISTRLPEDRW